MVYSPRRTGLGVLGVLSAPLGRSVPGAPPKLSDTESCLAKTSLDPGFSGIQNDILKSMNWSTLVPKLIFWVGHLLIHQWPVGRHVFNDTFYTWYGVVHAVAMERAPAVSLKLQGWFQYFDYHGNGRLSKSELLRGIVKAYDAACPSFVVVDVFVMARKQQQKEMLEMNFAFSKLPADMGV